MKTWSWLKVLIVILAIFVVGNAAMTLFLYLIGQPNLSAWTGHVAQSSPSALNDMLLGIVSVIQAFYILRHCD